MSAFDCRRYGLTEVLYLELSHSEPIREQRDKTMRYMRRTDSFARKEVQQVRILSRFKAIRFIRYHGIGTCDSPFFSGNRRGPDPLRFSSA